MNTTSIHTGAFKVVPLLNGHPVVIFLSLAGIAQVAPVALLALLAPVGQVTPRHIPRHTLGD